MPVNSSSAPTTISTGPRTPVATASSSADATHSLTLLGSPDSPTHAATSQLLADFGLTLVTVADGAPIPGSHWGEPEAGLLGTQVHARRDTPLHSVLHESCHVICMDPTRRDALDTDAGGSAIEECGVCYLSIALADAVPGFGSRQMLADMDAWGYSFRLGSAERWFYEDADDAKEWLRRHGLLNAEGLAEKRLRGTPTTGASRERIQESSTPGAQ